MIPTYDWLKQYYFLPKEGADLPGEYNPDYVPYLWGIFAALDDPKIKAVAVMKAAQIGWTFALIGFIFRIIHLLPGPILVLFAKDGDARAFNDEKFVPTVRATPVVRRLIDVSTSRKSGNRSGFKNFPGGFIKNVGSNSTGNVKSTPAGLVVVEEPDDTSDNVKDQGNAIALADERRKRYRKSKLLIGGTPSIEDFSKIESFIKRSDQCVLPVKCHDCGEKHVLDWDHVSWLEADPGEVEEHEIYGYALPETAIYTCPHCGSAWNDWQRQQNILNTCREARDAGDKFCGWVPTADSRSGVKGFKELSELYVCIPGTSLADVVTSYLEAEHQAAIGIERDRIVFINSKLGRPYKYGRQSHNVDLLKKRAEQYDEFTVPDGGLVLTAGVDVQHDRLAITIWAYGRGMEMWLVYWGEIYAQNTTVDKTDPVWDELDKILFTPRKHEKGFMIGLSAADVDCSDGTTAETVYDYVVKRQHKGVMAAKGDSHDYGKKEIYTKPKEVDFKSKTKASKYGLKVYMVGTHKAKDLIIGENGRITLEGNGPGRMHWYEDVREDFLDQLLAESKIPQSKGKARGKMVWACPSGKRNEGGDCTFMSVHAAYSLNLHRWSNARWDNLEKSLSQVDMFSAANEPVTAESKPKEIVDLTKLAEEMNR